MRLPCELKPPPEPCWQPAANKPSTRSAETRRAPRPHALAKTRGRDGGEVIKYRRPVQTLPAPFGQGRHGACRLRRWRVVRYRRLWGWKRKSSSGQAMGDAEKRTSVVGIIPAAGRSGRMGTPKQLLHVDGKPMLLGVVDALLGGGVARVVVVTNSV